ncbi:MAG: ABC transporter substrate-binding protein [Thermoleophilia bacterium]|nr:ABC transporter substrate-binding protein [Thermoleophilia bacterium]
MKRLLAIAGIIALALVVALAVAACGEKETTTTAAPSTTAPPSTQTTAGGSTSTTASGETTASTGAPAKEDVLKIGAISSATGDMATAFKAMYDSVGPTQELLNEMGGVTVGDTHYRIEIKFYDDQSTTAGGLTAINKLIGEGIKYVVPPMFMPINLAIAPLCEENKIMRIKSFGAGNVEVNPDNPLMFFTCSGVANIKPFFDYALAKYPNVKTVAVITPDDPGAATYQQLIKEEYEKRGIKIVYWEVYPQPTFDFYSILNKALATKPDAIDGIFGIPPCTSAIINQSRELGFAGPVFGPCTLGDANVVNAMVTPEYRHDILSYVPDVNSDKMTEPVKKLGEKIKAKGASFELDSLHLLDAISAIIAGIKAAGSIDPEAVAAAIDNGKCTGFEGAYGPAVWGSYVSVYGNKHCAEHAPMVTTYTKEGLLFEWLPWDGTAHDKQ